VCSGRSGGRCLRPGGPAEGGDRGRDPLGLKALPGLLAFPELDRANALVGRAREVQDQASRGGIHQPGGHPLVLVQLEATSCTKAWDNGSSVHSGPRLCGRRHTFEEAGLAAV
jgi:hypothetical protein